MNIMSVFTKFPTQESCLKHLESVRWPKGPNCPYCKSNRVTALPKESRYHCNNCLTSFSVTVGTIFHHTHLPLQKWFLAVSLILNAKKGISSRQLSRDLEVNKDTAWRIAMQIRKAMTQKWQRDLLSGIVEMDETYLGGKPRKFSDPEGENKRGRGTKRPAVVGMVEREGNVIAKPFKKGSLDSKNLSMFVREHVDIKNTTLMTDEYKGYIRLKYFIDHQVIDHTIGYANGTIHTNTIESFWALLKRGLVGQFHKVSIKYLPKYVDEFCYRFNNRNNDNSFELTIAKGLGV
jgi:transposase-like protein